MWRGAGCSLGTPALTGDTWCPGVLVGTCLIRDRCFCSSSSSSSCRWSRWKHLNPFIRTHFRVGSHALKTLPDFSAPPQLQRPLEETKSSVCVVWCGMGPRAGVFTVQADSTGVPWSSPTLISALLFVSWASDGAAEGRRWLCCLPPIIREHNFYI